jgi:hypothetical protein
MAEAPNEWMVFVFAEGGLMARLFEKDKRGAALDSLYASVRRCLEAESSVTGVREEP